MQVTIRVVGRLWLPPAIAATTYRARLVEDGQLTAGSIERSELTREGIEDWLTRNAGDFSAVEDFSADWTTPLDPCPTCKQARCDSHEIGWNDPDSEFTWADATFGSEE